MLNSTFNLIVFLGLTFNEKRWERKTAPGINYFIFLSLFILTHTTEIAATPKTPTTREETIILSMMALADEGVTSGNTEKIGS